MSSTGAAAALSRTTSRCTAGLNGVDASGGARDAGPPPIGVGHGGGGVRGHAGHRHGARRMLVAAEDRAQGRVDGRGQDVARHLAPAAAHSVLSVLPCLAASLLCSASSRARSQQQTNKLAS